MSKTARSLLLIAAAVILLNSSVAEARNPKARRPVHRFHGTWISDCNGHHGLLNARVVQSGCQTYKVTFTGTFLGVVPFVYSTPMTVTGRTPDGAGQLHAHSLLPVFGDFDCTAHMNTCQFSANYRSESDRGRFTMQSR